MEMAETVKEKEKFVERRTKKSSVKSYIKLLKVFFKWLVISVTVGIIVGAVGALFHTALDFAADTREKMPWILYLLPLVGVIIIFIYKAAKMEDDTGTNAVILEARGEDSVNWKVVPLIFVSTFLTHLCGGSAGREGAALQIGAGTAKPLGRLFRLKNGDTAIIAMCGMAAGFSSLFGTPAASAVFAMEVSFAGVIACSGVFPCIISAVTAAVTASAMGVRPTSFDVRFVPTFGGLSSVDVIAKVLLLAFLCAAVSVLFCESMHGAAKLYEKFIKNRYLRALAGAALIILLTTLIGNTDYNGAGTDVIERAFKGETVWYAFLLKILFTALTLGAGYKGGEIVPTFFTGATFGCFMAPILGLPASFGAAVGLLSVFCGVSNCPLASVLLGVELFGSDGLIYYIIGIGVSYLLSGYKGLYGVQSFFISKSRLRIKEVYNVELHTGEGKL